MFALSRGAVCSCRAVAAQFASELHAELHAGGSQKMVGACFQPRLTRQPAKSYGSYGSYGHMAAWHCATLPRLPGMEASSLPSLRHTKVGIPTSLYTKVGIPTSLFCPKNPSPGQRRRSVSEAVLAGATDRVFFHHSHAQPSILAWAKDCPTQSWRGHRIAPVSPTPLNSGVGTGLPD